MSESAAPLRGIPQIDLLLARAADDPILAAVPRTWLRDAVREGVNEVRVAWREGRGPHAEYFESREFLDDLRRSLAPKLRRRHESVINATGILLHTGLGRAPLSDAAIDAAADAGRYAIVEVDSETGERDLREARCAELLCELTGAEAATVVNNNAAATLLVLSALGAGREVVASRGELVEIGGGFRMPDVMARAGCILREVGTTNRTYARDYAEALGPDTALVLKVHTSNFRVLGFTHAASVRELAELRGIPLVYDLGSGLPRRIHAEPSSPLSALAGEPTAKDAVADGAAIVCFSGDKLLCGPQSGLIVGRRTLVAQIRAAPLFRALRPGKLDLAALEATLLAWRAEPAVAPDLPLYRQLALELEDLRARANALLAAIGDAPVRAEVVDSVGYLGSGSAPAREVMGIALAIRSATRSPDEMAARLRESVPRVFARVADGAVRIELRTVLDDQLGALAAAVRHVTSDTRDLDSAS